MKTRKNLPQAQIDKKNRQEHFTAPIIIFLIMIAITSVFFNDLKNSHLFVGIPMFMVFLVSIFGKDDKFDLKLRVWYFFIGSIGSFPSFYELFIR